MVFRNLEPRIWWNGGDELNQHLIDELQTEHPRLWDCLENARRETLSVVFIHLDSARMIPRISAARGVSTGALVSSD